MHGGIGNETTKPKYDTAIYDVTDETWRDDINNRMFAQS